MHYDQIFLRAGPPTVLTAWVPLGDIAIDGGGLLYLEDSASVGQGIEKGFTGAAKDFTEEERVSAFNAHMMEGGFSRRIPASFPISGGSSWLPITRQAMLFSMTHSTFTAARSTKRTLFGWQLI